MQDIDPMVLAIAAGGLMLLVIRLVPLFLTEINAPAFNAQIEKLLKAGNRDRALKLCGAAPNSAYVQAVKALLEESGARSAHDGEGLIRESIKEAYDREVARQKQRLGKLGWLAPLGVVAVGGAIFLALGAEQPPPNEIFIVPALAAAMWLASYRKVRLIHRYFREGLDQLLPLATDYVLQRSRNN